MRYYRRKNEEKTAVKKIIANKGSRCRIGNFYIFEKNVVDFCLNFYSCHNFYIYLKI